MLPTRSIPRQPIAACPAIWHLSAGRDEPSPFHATRIDRGPPSALVSFRFLPRIIRNSREETHATITKPAPFARQDRREYTDAVQRQNPGSGLRRAGPVGLLPTTEPHRHPDWEMPDLPRRRGGLKPSRGGGIRSSVSCNLSLHTSARRLRRSRGR